MGDNSFDWQMKCEYGTKIRKDVLKTYVPKVFPHHTEEFKALLKDFNEKQLEKYNMYRAKHGALPLVLDDYLIGHA